MTGRVRSTVCFLLDRMGQNGPNAEGRTPKPRPNRDGDLRAQQSAKPMMFGEARVPSPVLRR